MQLLADHPLAATINARLAALAPAVPSTAGFSPVPQPQWTAVQTCAAANVKLAFDGTTGALVSLTLPDGNNYADLSHTLGGFIYQTYNGTVAEAQKDYQVCFATFSSPTLIRAPLLQYQYACCFEKSFAGANPQHLTGAPLTWTACLYTVM
jgi:hypothetical protein